MPAGGGSRVLAVDQLGPPPRDPYRSKDQFCLSWKAEELARPAFRSRIRYIQQRAACDCVIAVTAMVANMPYETVARLAPVASHRRGFLPWEAHRLLEDATSVRWRRPACVHFRRLESLCDAKDTLVLFIRQRKNLLVRLFTRSTRHCIAARNGRVFDPAIPFARSLEKYPRADWIPCIAFRPVDARQLAAIQSRNDEQYRTDRLWSEILNPCSGNSLYVDGEGQSR